MAKRPAPAPLVVLARTTKRSSGGLRGDSNDEISNSHDEETAGSTQLQPLGTPMIAYRRKDMGWNLRRAGLAAAAIALALPAAQAPGLAHAQVPAPSPPERLSWYGDPKAPDLSGVWLRVDTDGKAGPGSASKEGWLPWPPPLKAPFAEMWKKRVADAAAGKRTDDPVRKCLPPGMPRFITGTNGPLLIIQTPGRVMIYREGIPVRRVWLTGVKLPAPKDIENFFNGNSIGRYEGSDLVTEVAGMKDLPIDSTGVPHSDELKIMERYHRVDPTTLKVVVTLTDPKAYAKPMVSTITYKASDTRYWEPEEFVCTPGTNYHPDRYVH